MNFFWRFWAATHFPRSNCADIAKDRLRQPAYEIFSIRRRFQWSKSRSPMFKEESIKERYLFKMWLSGQLNG